MSAFNFENLFLIQGTSPLPNYVIADYFIQKNDKLKKIWIIHSEEYKNQSGTRGFADKISKFLKKKYPNKEIKFQIDNLSIREAGRYSGIVSVIEDNKDIEGILEDTSGIHLNFTGGTKAMAVYIYHALSERYKGNSRLFSSSYLDARQFKIFFHNDNESSYDLRDHINIDFDKLLELHGFRYKAKTDKSNKGKFYEFDKLLDTFDKIIESGKLNEFYSSDNSSNSYGYDYFRKMVHDGKLIKITELTENIDEDYQFNKNETYKSILDKCFKNEIFKKIFVNEDIPAEYMLFENKNNHILINKKISQKNFEKIFKFIDGRWLEDYVFKKIKDSDISQELSSVIERNKNIEKLNSDGNDFEIDILLRRGYQLTGISITTDSSKSICKEKGFEILHRTIQIGGEESKAILITRVDKETQNKLQDELSRETGSSDEHPNILVFGECELRQRDFLNKIKKFIK